jgi:hypothetical protein
LTKWAPQAICPLIHKHPVALQQHRLLAIQRNGEHVKDTYAEHYYQAESAEQCKQKRDKVFQGFGF